MRNISTRFGLVAMLVAVALLAFVASGDTARAIPPQGYIDKFAGGWSGTGAPAAEIAINKPSAIAGDPSGDMFVAADIRCFVYRITGGVVTAFAGTGVCGFSGDGGPATSAQIGAITSIAVAPSGDVYLADGCRIRLVSGGMISTIAGSGGCTFNGNTIAAMSAGIRPTGIALEADGDLLIADEAACRIRHLSGGIITTIAGSGNCVLAGGGGDGGPPLLGNMTPHSLAIAANGDIYMLERQNCALRRISGGIITRIAGGPPCGSGGDGGPALSASLAQPQGISLDTNGDIYFGDTGSCRVRVISGGVINSIAGSVCDGQADPQQAGDGGPATAAKIHQPVDVMVEGGGVYIAESNNCRVRVVTGGTISTFAGRGRIAFGCDSGGDGGPAESAGLSCCGGIAVAPNGDVYISEVFNCVVRRVAGGIITTVAGSGTCAMSTDGAAATTSFGRPVDMAIAPSGELHIFESVDGVGCRVTRVSGAVYTHVAGAGACGYSGDNGPALAAQIESGSLAIDPAGDVFIRSGSPTCRIRKISAGTITTFAGTGVCGYNGDGAAPSSTQLGSGDFAVDSNGDLYLNEVVVGTSSVTNCRVRRIAAGVVQTIGGDGTCINVLDEVEDNVPATTTGFRPAAIAVRNGEVFVRDGTCRIRRISAGIVRTVAGTFIITCNGNTDSGNGGPALYATVADYKPLAIDAATGVLYLGADYQVRLMTPDVDLDADDVFDAIDNCPALANTDQANNTRNFIDHSPPYSTSVDDKTVPGSDATGDPCDADDDNDGVSDADEASGAACSGAITNPLVRDTDGDRFLDGAECTLGTDPTVFASKPAITACGATTDVDGDKLSERIEVCFYGTDPGNSDSDGDKGFDGAKDGCEAASLNGDRVVNVADMGMLASAIGNVMFRVVSVDVNKDGAWNPADQGLVASFISPAGQCPG